MLKILFLIIIICANCIYPEITTGSAQLDFNGTNIVIDTNSNDSMTSLATCVYVPKQHSTAFLYRLSTTCVGCHPLPVRYFHVVSLPVCLGKKEKRKIKDLTTVSVIPKRNIVRCTRCLDLERGVYCSVSLVSR